MASQIPRHSGLQRWAEPTSAPISLSGRSSDEHRTEPRRLRRLASPSRRSITSCQYEAGMQGRAAAMRADASCGAPVANVGVYGGTNGRSGWRDAGRGIRERLKELARPLLSTVGGRRRTRRSMVPAVPRVRRARLGPTRRRANRGAGGRRAGSVRRRAWWAKRGQNKAAMFAVIDLQGDPPEPGLRASATRRNPAQADSPAAPSTGAAAAS